MAAWATLIRTLGPAITRMIGGSQARAAAGGASRGAAGGMSGVKPAGSAWPSMMHAGNQDAASKAKRVEDERTEATNQANESLKNLAKGFATAGPAVLLFSVGFKKTVQHVAEFNRQFAQYNGKTAASFAQLDVNRVRRDIAFGNATSGSSTGLNSSLNKLEEAFLPLEVALTELLNSGLIVLIDLAKPVIDGMSAIVKGIDMAVDAARDAGLTKRDLITDEAWARIEAAKRMQGHAGGLGAFLGGLGGGGGGAAQEAAAQFRGRVVQQGYARSQEFRDRVNGGTAGYAAGVAAYESSKARRSATHRLNRGLKPGGMPPLG